MCPVPSAWLFEILQTWVDLLRALDEKIQASKAALAKGCSGPRPKGAGANSLVQLQSEVLDWDLYPTPRKIACRQQLLQLVGIAAGQSCDHKSTHQGRILAVMMSPSAGQTGVTIGIFSPNAQYRSNHRQASTCAMFRFSMLELPKPSKYRRRPSRSTYPCFNPCALASAT
jgi:hypothetical protein